MNLRFLTATALLSAGLAFTAAASEINLTSDYNRVSAAYQYRPIEDADTHGFEVGYIHGFSLTKQFPVFFQTGLKLDMGFKSESESSIFDGLNVRTSAALTTLSLSVPADIAIRVGLDGGKMAFIPYLGLNLKLNCLATISAKANMHGYEIKESESLFDYDMRRFQLGWHVGAGMQISNFFIGANFGTDFISIYEGGGHTPAVHVGLGYMF